MYTFYSFEGPSPQHTLFVDWLVHLFVGGLLYAQSLCKHDTLLTMLCSRSKQLKLLQMCSHWSWLNAQKLTEMFQKNACTLRGRRRAVALKRTGWKEGSANGRNSLSPGILLLIELLQLGTAAVEVLSECRRCCHDSVGDYSSSSGFLLEPLCPHTEAVYVCNFTLSLSYVRGPSQRIGGWRVGQMGSTLGRLGLQIHNRVPPCTQM